MEPTAKPVTSQQSINRAAPKHALSSSSLLLQLPPSSPCRASAGESRASLVSLHSFRPCVLYLHPQLYHTYPQVRGLQANTPWDGGFQQA